MLWLMRSSTTAAAPAYHPNTPALAPELGRAYAAECARASAAGDAKLRDITVALVQRLKDDGLPPERVIVALKTAIVRYGKEHRPPSLSTDDDDGRRCGGEVYERVFAWMLEAYFGAG